MKTSNIALSGCGRRSATNPTIISYSEVGVCKSYATLTGNEEKAKPSFAIFKIETVDNTKQSSPFNLDPERFFVDQTPAEMKQKNISFQSRRWMSDNCEISCVFINAGQHHRTLPSASLRRSSMAPRLRT
jgi:hypothetical protein